MTELARPTAKRLQRPSWRDSRLVVGVLLVLVAATLGAKAVASADDRVPVWAAVDDLVAGDRVEAASARTVTRRTSTSAGLPIADAGTSSPALTSRTTKLPSGTGASADR